MLRKLWRAEKAAWAAWRAALKPPPPAVPLAPAVESAPAQTITDVVIAPAAVVWQPPAKSLPPADPPELLPERWTLFDGEDRPAKGLMGMTSAELEEIRQWPWRKYDRKNAAFR